MTPSSTLNTPSSPRLTCLIGTYNEAARLPAFLAHAKQWADEIVIVDKSSTDDTTKLVEAIMPRGEHQWPCPTGLTATPWHHGDVEGKEPWTRLIHVPFTPQGHEDKSEQFKFCQTDWVFLMTPGEVPTRGLIAAARDALAQYGDTADIITIPKKLYSFGIHNPASPWSIGQQPFLVNRKRAIISNHVHRNFSLRPDGKAHHIPYSETCHVYHPTHATVTAFLRSHFDYILAEVEGCANPDALLAEAQQQIMGNQFKDASGRMPPELFGQSCAWKIYWLGCMLAAHERKLGRNVPQEYRQETSRRITAEWL